MIDRGHRFVRSGAWMALGALTCIAGPRAVAQVSVGDGAGFPIAHHVPRSVATRMLPARIDDSGETACYAGAGDDPVQPTACTDTDWPDQDASTGRDAAAAAGDLVKVGAGAAGFDFTKLSNAGAELPPTAASGSGPNDWGCTRDNVTGLVWRIATAPTLSWTNARDAARAANAGGGACGFADWRLPSSIELQSIVDYGAADPAVDATYFPATAAAFYWTAETDAGAPSERARVVNFNGGFVNAAPIGAAAGVRFVRGGASFGPISDDGDGTVTDPRTGLMWDRCSLGQDDATTCAGDVEAPNWQDALQEVAQRNAQNWRGHSDWRLPNVKELMSLVEPARTAPTIDAAAFPNTPGGAYWTSTTNVHVPRTAWAVFFGDADVFAVDKVNPARVRLVRTATAAASGGPLDAVFADGFDVADVEATVPSDRLARIAIVTTPEYEPPAVPPECAADPSPYDSLNSICDNVYLPATITVASPDPTQNYSGTLRIKGHGNSTWSMPKQPFRLKLDDKAPLLGMPEDKNWVLLANYDDKSLMRDYVAYTLGANLPMAWSPRSRFAEVELNGRYVGIYQLTETIRVAEDRVDIAEIEPGDVAPPEVTGGYLFELDTRLDCAASQQFITPLGVPFCIDTPDEDAIVSQQHDYLAGYMQQTESAIFGANFADPVSGYAAYIDTPSFVDWYLVNELFKNVDAIGVASVWQYKDREGKLMRGPLWDFDISAGNMNYGSPDPRGFWIRTSSSTYYSRLCQDPAFAAAIRARWDAVKAAQIDALPTLIDATAATLRPAVDANFEQWP
ncbi:MAG TPA: DUF1566 domain-containing protein, partial [Dokdonella sp.]